MNAHLKGARRGGFTLIELLLTVAIIAILISLLVPALNRGQSKVKGLQCRSNLHQTGLGMIYFAHNHEDKYPMQVSTNLGGSAEFITAGNAVRGEFYFSFKHFLPLAGDLQTPKVLICPADVRQPAPTFASLKNTNVSYFVAANPAYMNSDSVLSGDRNLSPISNSIARLSPTRPLKWTHEMHQFRGNILFADGHVEQLTDVLSLSNSPGGPLISLVMPSSPAPVPRTPPPILTGGGGGAAGSGGGPGYIPGGNLAVSTHASNSSGGFAATNVSAPLTNLTVTSGPRNIPPSAYLLGGPGAGPSVPVLSSSGSNRPADLAVASSTNPPQPPNLAAETETETEMTSAEREAAASTTKALAKRAAHPLFGLPWWLLALLLALTLWLLKRAREHRIRSAPDKTKERPWFYAGKHGL